MRVQLQMLSCCALAVLSMASMGAFASASNCGGPTAPGPNFGNSSTSSGTSNYSSSSSTSTSGTANYTSGSSASGGSGGTYASQAPIAANSSTPMNPTMYASQAPSAVQTASQAAAPRTIDTTVHAGTYTTSAANTPHTTPVTSAPTPASSGPTTGAIQPKKILNPDCDCYEYESDIAAVSNTNQIAAQQLLSATGTAGAVPWTATLDYAREAALAKMEPYAIYFCSEAAARTAGDGPAAKTEYKKSHDGRSPTDTIFDNSGVLRAFDAAGIAVFVKVPLTAGNAKLAEKWNAHENTLIVAAPNDEKLKVFNREECNENNVAEYLMGFKEKYKMWKWKAQMAAVNERNAQK